MYIYRSSLGSEGKQGGSSIYIAVTLICGFVVLVIALAFLRPSPLVSFERLFEGSILQDLHRQSNSPRPKGFNRLSAVRSTTLRLVPPPSASPTATGQLTGYQPYRSSSTRAVRAGAAALHHRPLHRWRTRARSTNHLAHRLRSYRRQEQPAHRWSLSSLTAKSQQSERGPVWHQMKTTWEYRHHRADCRPS